VKSLPKIFNFEAQIAIVLDGFNSKKLSFLYPVYQLSQTFSFVQNFLNFAIKKFMFGDLDYPLEIFPIIWKP